MLMPTFDNMTKKKASQKTNVIVIAKLALASSLLLGIKNTYFLQCDVLLYLNVGRCELYYITLHRVIFYFVYNIIF